MYYFSLNFFRPLVMLVGPLFVFAAFVPGKTEKNTFLVVHGHTGLGLGLGLGLGHMFCVQPEPNNSSSQKKPRGQKKLKINLGTLFLQTEPIAPSNVTEPLS